jgi:hypothetical protein
VGRRYKRKENSIMREKNTQDQPGVEMCREGTAQENMKNHTGLL